MQSRSRDHTDFCCEQIEPIRKGQVEFKAQALRAVDDVFRLIVETWSCIIGPNRLA